ncbi:MAG: metallophosphoesterase [Gammaproteobacteria bacterium]|nr:metallophosphoesterase [Gammaproteobacteria bacterium]MBU1653485.1 metallophosphoesterase [Gammaproteobacteria bacterium]MBU1962726.1 metallophosphoesterase [Gammaproteobacteria bacterium]
MKSWRYPILRAVLVLLLSTPAQASESFVFAVFGDTGMGGRGQHQVAQAMHRVCQERGCRFTLLVGDNIYDSGVSSVGDSQFLTKFERPYAIFGDYPFYLIPGNHDWDGDVQAQIDYSSRSTRWRMPHFHYPVPDLPPWLSIYGLDTVRMDQGQVEAARNHLCGRPGWRILFGHYPIFSNGSHGDSSRMIRRLLPLIQECKVQAYFAGHDHHQEHISAPGFDAFIQGAGASVRRVRTRSGPERNRGLQRFAAAKTGFAVVEVSPALMKVDFYDAQGAGIYHFEAKPDSIGQIDPPSLGQ